MVRLAHDSLARSLADRAHFKTASKQQTIEKEFI